MNVINHYYKNMDYFQIDKKSIDYEIKDYMPLFIDNYIQWYLRRFVLNLEINDNYPDEDLDLSDYVSLKVLNCKKKVKSIINLPETLQHLFVKNLDLTSLILPPNLQQLLCQGNKLTSLNLPKTLIVLYCHENQLTTLEIPSKLKTLICAGNKLTTLNIPQDSQLTILNCNDNFIEVFDFIPPNIEVFTFQNNPTIKINGIKELLTSKTLEYNDICSLRRFAESASKSI